MRQVILVLIFMYLLIPMLAQSQNISIDDYLIRADMGDYKRITKGGPSGDILAGAGHLSEDHIDESYGIAYHNKVIRLWVDVQVTKHAGSDSDRWLLHEIDADFRNYYGIPGMAYTSRQIDGQSVLVAL